MVLADLASKRYESRRLPTHQVGVFTLMVTVVSILLSACAPVDEKPATIYRLPWLDANGAYSIQDIPLTTFTEPESLRGSVGEIVVDPRITASTIEANEPIGRWVREGAYMRPADFVTQQAATLYAHLERLATIDTETDVGRKMKGISRVGMLVRISESVSSPMILNNAVYDGRLDALFIVPYAGELLPISQNAGIIGHEHFHRIFQSIVLTPIRELARHGAIPDGIEYETPCAGGIVEKTEEPSADATDTIGAMVPLKVLNQTLVRGANEGFADFWGWAYSRDEEFVSRSLGMREDAARRLDRSVGSLPQKVGFRNSLITVNRTGFPVLKSDGARVAASYKIGTEYARILRGVVETLVTNGGLSRETAIEKVRLALAQSLETLSIDVTANWTREELEPELMLKPFFTKLIRMSSAGPAVLDSSTVGVACAELIRLQASDKMLSGLCEKAVKKNAPASLRK